VFATGTTALLIVAVMVVALSPARQSAPEQVIATTLPAAIEFRRPASAIATADTQPNELVGVVRRTMIADAGLELAGAPYAVSAATASDLDDFTVAVTLPADGDPVLLLTRSHAYALDWEDVFDVLAPDGSIVTDRTGRLLATWVGDELRLLVD
jgi:hypothetical protein